MASIFRRRPLGEVKDIGGERVFVPSGWYITTLLVKDSSGVWNPVKETYELGKERDKFFVEGQSVNDEFTTKDEHLAVGEPLEMDIERWSLGYNNDNIK